MDERRARPRHRRLKSAKISFAKGAVIDCVLRNISNEGACLEVESQIGIPRDFNLMLDHDHSSHVCRVMWRSDRRIGVAFIR